VIEGGQNADRFIDQVLGREREHELRRMLRALAGAL
jgi:hypothetical protein